MGVQHRVVLFLVTAAGRLGMWCLATAFFGCQSGSKLPQSRAAIILRSPAHIALRVKWHFLARIGKFWLGLQARWPDVEATCVLATDKSAHSPRKTRAGRVLSLVPTCFFRHLTI